LPSEGGRGFETDTPDPPLDRTGSKGRVERNQSVQIQHQGLRLETKTWVPFRDDESEGRTRPTNEAKMRAHGRRHRSDANLARFSGRGMDGRTAWAQNTRRATRATPVQYLQQTPPFLNDASSLRAWRIGTSKRTSPGWNQPMEGPRDGLTKGGFSSTLLSLRVATITRKGVNEGTRLALKPDAPNQMRGRGETRTEKADGRNLERPPTSHDHLRCPYT